MFIVTIFCLISEINRLVTHVTRLCNAVLEEPAQLYEVDLDNLTDFIHKLDSEGYNLLVYVDSRNKKGASSHDKLKELESQCKNLRIQHILYRSLCTQRRADNIRKAVANSLKKMGQTIDIDI